MQRNKAGFIKTGLVPEIQQAKLLCTMNVKLSIPNLILEQACGPKYALHLKHR